MVAFTLCAGCSGGDHDRHAYWIQKPPKGVIGGFACRCPGPQSCAGNGEKLLRSLFGDDAIDRAGSGERQEWVGPVAPGSDIPPLRLSLAYDDQGRTLLGEAFLAQLLLDAGWERTA